MGRLERTVVASDFHFAAEDTKLVRAFLRFVKQWRPDNVFLNGDIIDNSAVSKHLKHPMWDRPLGDDVKATKNFLKQLRASLPDARIVYLAGNHEWRLDSYLLRQAPEIYGYLNLREILGLDDLEIEWVFSGHKENWIKYHDIYIGHFDKALGRAGYTASSLLTKYGVNLIQGHTHRIGMSAVTLMEKTLFAFEGGGLLDVDVGYVKSPDWQQGFLTILWDGTESFINLHPVKNNSFEVQGQVYKI